VVQYYRQSILNERSITAAAEKRSTMKNTGTCPKCKSNDIVRIDGYVGPYGSGNNVIVGRTIFSTVNVNRYICCSCGFTEEWIDAEDIASIAESKRAKR